MANITPVLFFLALLPLLALTSTCGHIPFGGCAANCPCSDGTCCSQFGYCGTTNAHCDAGCQNGPCTSPPPPPECASIPFGACAANCPCADGTCCSYLGYCGTTNAHCDAGCQNGPCTSPPPPPPPPPQCGHIPFGGCAANCPCSDGTCCSQFGYCGTTNAHCDAGCQNGPCTTPKGVIFSPYKDISINFNFVTKVISTKIRGIFEPVLNAYQGDTLTWAFATGECGAETWAGVSGAALATANVPLFNAKNVDYIISTGGPFGDFTCSSVLGMKAFIDRYNSQNLIGVDFDLQRDLSAVQLDSLMDSIKGVQVFYPNLRYSFTLPTLAATDGTRGSLDLEGKMILNAIRSKNINDYIINLRTMNYGSPASSSKCYVTSGMCNMGQSAIQAVQNVNISFGVPKSQIEITPMIGRNEVTSLITTLADVDTITNWAKFNGIIGHHIWSFDRDTPCAQSKVSPTCSSLSSPGNLAYQQRYLSANLD